jgi:hypothetical protein
MERHNIIGTGKQASKAKATAPKGTLKSWKTSHLPVLSDYELQGLLSLMYAWYHNEQFEFSNECNWPNLWEYIDRNGLGGILGSAVLEGICHIPEEFSQMSIHRYFSNQIHYEQAHKCCHAVEEAARQLNVPIRILKGPAIVRQGYVDTGVRSFSDIDLFTDSPENVRRLCEKLQVTLHKSSAKQNILERMGESENIGFYFNNWDLEFRYPLDPPGEPMFELLSYNSKTLLKVPQHADDILEPDVALHLAFLIQHMAVHHLFSRFFWFLDLAVLVRNNPRINYEMVESELQRLGLNNAALVISRFCRKYIDPNFPVLTKLIPSWNFPMISQLADPVNIASGRFGIYHRNLGRRIFAYLIGATSFYIIADPGGKEYGFGTTWTLNRFRNSFGVKKPIPWIDFLLRPVILFVLLPMARILSYMACRERG